MAVIDKNSDYFGIDIGTTGVRLVQLKSGSGAPSLVTYGVVNTEENLINNDSDNAKNKLANAISKLTDDARVSTKNVVAGLPSEHTFSTVITTPRMNKSQLDKSIQLQADQYIPMSIDDAKLDWQIINEQSDSDELEVLLVAANNNIVNRYLEVVELAGLDLYAIEVNALAAARSVVSAPDTAVVILDIGNANTEIAVVWNKVPYLIRSINVGYSTLVRSVEKNLNVDKEQAGQFLQKFGVAQTKLEGQVLNAVKSSLDSMLDEVSKSIKYFKSQKSEVETEKIILTGGPSSLPEMPSYIANSLNLPVEIANPWINVNYPAKQQDQLMQYSMQLTVASGLAQRDYI